MHKYCAFIPWSITTYMSVGSMAQWLGRRSVAGGLSLIYA